MAVHEVSGEERAQNLRELDEAKATWQWWEENHAELLERYAERYVVIDKEREVIGAYPSLDATCDAMEAEGLVFGRDVDAEFITANRRWRL